MIADRRACVKRKHKTLEDAMIALKQQPMKCLQPYQCKKCGSWHLAQQKRGGHYFQTFIDRVMRSGHDRRAELIEKANSAYFRVGIPETPNARMAAAVSLIRAEVLEEAARVADENGAGLAANRIRALKSGT